MDKNAFEQKCYEAYQLDWLISHGYSLNDLYKEMLDCMSEALDPVDFSDDPFNHNDLEYLAETGKEMFLTSQGLGGGSIYACKDEFLESEFQDRAYMEHLISLMPNSKEMEAFWREEYGICTYEPKIEVPTSAGVIKAYESTDPGQPGICVALQPTGYEDEIDMAFVSVYEDPGYATADGERPEDAVIMSYGDATSEDYTVKEIVRREDVIAGLGTGGMV